MGKLTDERESGNEEHNLRPKSVDGQRKKPLTISRTTDFPNRGSGRRNRAGFRCLVMRRDGVPAWRRTWICRRTDRNSHRRYEALRRPVSAKIAALIIHQIILLVEREVP